MHTDLLPTAEVARLLGRDVSTINRMVTAGDLTPAVKGPGVRGAYLFHRADVDALRIQRQRELEAELAVLSGAEPLDAA